MKLQEAEARALLKAAVARPGAMADDGWYVAATFAALLDIERSKAAGAIGALRLRQRGIAADITPGLDPAYAAKRRERLDELERTIFLLEGGKPAKRR